MCGSLRTVVDLLSHLGNVALDELIDAMAAVNPAPARVAAAAQPLGTVRVRLRRDLAVGHDAELGVVLRSRLVRVGVLYDVRGPLGIDSADLTPGDLDFYSDAAICRAVADRILSDVQAAVEDGMHVETVESFGRRLLKLAHRDELIGGALDLADKAEGRRRSASERRAVARAVIAGDPFDSEAREDGESRSHYAARQVCGFLYDAYYADYFAGGPEAPPAGVLRSAALPFGELLAWAAIDPAPVTSAGWAAPDSRSPGISSSNPEVRARWSRACRALGALAACAATQLVMADGSRPDLSLGSEALVVRAGVGDVRSRS